MKKIILASFFMHCSCTMDYHLRYINPLWLYQPTRYINQPEEPFETEYLCDYDNCTDAFTTEYALEKHLQYDHSKNNYECGVCKKNFTNFTQFNIHFISHINKQKPHRN